MISKMLRERAQRCLRLAQSIYNADAAAALEAYSRQLEATAERMEIEARRAAEAMQRETENDSCC